MILVKRLNVKIIFKVVFLRKHLAICMLQVYRTMSIPINFDIVLHGNTFNILIKIFATFQIDAIFFLEIIIGIN